MRPTSDFSWSARFTYEITLKSQRANETTSSDRTWGHQNIHYFIHFISTCDVDAEWMISYKCYRNCKTSKAWRGWAAAQTWPFSCCFISKLQHACIGMMHVWVPERAETTVFVMSGRPSALKVLYLSSGNDRPPCWGWYGLGAKLL